MLKLGKAWYQLKPPQTGFRLTPRNQSSMVMTETMRSNAQLLPRSPMRHSVTFWSLTCAQLVLEIDLSQAATFQDRPHLLRREATAPNATAIWRIQQLQRKLLETECCFTNVRPRAVLPRASLRPAKMPRERVLVLQDHLVELHPHGGDPTIG